MRAEARLFIQKKTVQAQSIISKVKKKNQHLLEQRQHWAVECKTIDCDELKSSIKICITSASNIFMASQFISVVFLNSTAQLFLMHLQTNDYFHK